MKTPNQEKNTLIHTCPIPSQHGSGLGFEKVEAQFPVPFFHQNWREQSRCYLPSTVYNCSNQFGDTWGTAVRCSSVLHNSESRQKKCQELLIKLQDGHTIDYLRHREGAGVRLVWKLKYSKAVICMVEFRKPFTCTGLFSEKSWENLKLSPGLIPKLSGIGMQRLEEVAVVLSLSLPLCVCLSLSLSYSLFFLVVVS